MVYNNKIFCKGMVCYPTNIKYKCVDCGILLCSICATKTMSDNKYRCSKCYISTFSPDWDKMNKEFDMMILDINNTTTEANKNAKKTG